jgi:hypothetical protein
VGDSAVLWDVVTAEYGDVKDDVRSAGFDPDDEDTKVGILEVEWNGHPAGALVISSRARETGGPFLVSREPLVI